MPEDYDAGPKGRSPGPSEADREVIAKSIRFDLNRGRIELFGRPFLLIPPAFLVTIQKQLEETIGASAKGVLYLAGERSGLEYKLPGLERLRDARSREDAAAVFRDITLASSFRGLGRIAILEFDPADTRFAFRIEEGTFPEAYGPSKKPVCHVWAGWAAGVARQLFGREVLCEEVRCRAAGAEACEFVLQPRRIR